MEAGTQERLDHIVEDEVRRGYKCKDLPEELRKLLVAEGHQDIPRVRFSRRNPARRRKIGETVQRLFNKDLMDEGLLSEAQLLEQTAKSGEWSAEKHARMDELRLETGRKMRELFSVGVAEANWYEDILEAAKDYRDELTAAADAGALSEEQIARLVAVFDRWVEFDPSRAGLYAEVHAADQGREVYSPDADLAFLLDEAPSGLASDALNVIEDLRHRLYDLVQLQRDRYELDVLSATHARIFSESKESRRDTNEEMARVYFCTERVGPNDHPLGLLTPTFEAFWELPEEVMRWLLVEHHFFEQGLPDEAREYLETFGFIPAERAESADPTESVEPGDSPPSDGSPDPQTSNPASKQPRATAPASSASAAPTSSTTPS